MIRSFDASKMKEAAGEFNPPSFDYQAWVDNLNNIMLVDGDDVGLATFEYPGVYTVHWFFVSRGKQAFDVSTEMVKQMFTRYDAKVLRGLTPIKYKGACLLVRRIGFTSYGIENIDNEPTEIFIMTKQDFERINN